MSKLHEHLNSTGQSLTALARAIGVSPNYMSEIASFRRRPSLRVAYDIERATGGAIPMRHWIEEADSLASASANVSHTASKTATGKEAAHG